MRFDINLASQPYEDARAFYMRWGTALVVVILVTFGLLAFAVHEWLGARGHAARIHDIRQQIANIEAQRRDNEAILNRPENRTTRDRSQFINSLIARKGFSWTQVFSDLEKIMPAHVRVLSITPEVKEDRQIAIKMRVAGDSRQRTVEELARRLEQSPAFRQALVVREQASESRAGDKIQAEIEAIYLPELKSRGE